MNFERSQHHNKHIDSQFYKQIPSDWSSIRLKFVSNKVKTGSTPSTSVSEYFEDEVDWFTPEDFNSKIYLNSSKRKISTLAIDDGAAPLFPARTIFLVGIGSTGNVGIFHKAASSNQQINAIIVNKKILPEFLVYYLFSAKSIVKSLANLTLLSILNQEKTKQIPILLPPILEQKSIVEFLDYKTNQIDNLIDKKEKLLKLLEEKRIALITNAVTKGIDPNVKMKPTGIDWLGEIPEHWKLKRLKYCVSLINRKVTSENSPGKYIGLENIESWTAKFIESRDYSPEGTANKFEKGDVLFGKLRPYLAKAYLAEQKGICTTEALVLRPNQEILSQYLLNFILSHFFVDIVNSSTFGAKMPRADWEFIGNLPMVCPNVDEQKKIIEFINDEVNHIEVLQDRVNQIIEKLKEYRTSLITSAVTGKIDVRNWTPKEESKDDSLLEEVKEELK